jgi:hypothetical protein
MAEKGEGGATGSQRKSIDLKAAAAEVDCLRIQK